MNKNLKEDVSKIFTYHVDGWYNNEENKEGNKEGNKEDINYKKAIKINKNKLI